MAIRELPGRPKPFMMYYDNPYTKKRVSTSFATRKEAEKADALIKFRLKHERESFKPEDDEEIRPKKKAEDIPDDSLEAIDAAYIMEKRPCIKTLKWHMEGMAIPMRMIGRKRIGAIKRQDIAQIHAEYTKRGLVKTTIHSRMAALYALLRWAEKKGFVDSLPSLPELEHGEPEHFVPPTQKELSAMYAVAKDHIKRIILIGSRLGVRVGPSEMFKLKWENVDWEKGVMRVEAALKNKHEPWREVPIKASLLPTFRTWWAHDQLQGIKWIVHWNGKPIQTISKSWPLMLKEAGITRRIRPYDLRHAFATDAIAAGADIGTVAKLMGHVDVTMVLRTYQHVMTKQKVAAVEALPDIENVTNENVTKKTTIVKRVATR